MINEINPLKKENQNIPILNENNSYLMPLSKENDSQIPLLSKNICLNSEDDTYRYFNDFFDSYNSDKHHKSFKIDNYDNTNNINNIRDNNIIDNNNMNDNNNIIDNSIKDNNIIDNNKKDDKKIFNINKVNKVVKLGRSKKYSNRKGKHSKLAQDNVIRRFKVQFTKNILNYVNSLFKINNYGKSKIPIKIIKKPETSLTKSISKEDNLLWLNSRLEYIFSRHISSKLSNFESDYNEKLISRIYAKDEEKDVIRTLKKTVKEMMYIYKTDDKNNICPGFKTLKDDMKRFKDLGENKAYLEMYDLVVHNFEQIFYNIKSRKKSIL